MKKVFKIVGVVVLALVIGFAGLVVYVYYDKPDDIAEYSEQGMQQWLMDMVDKESNTETRYFYGDDGAVSVIEEDINDYLKKLSDDSPMYAYDISMVSYSIARELSYITATISVEYTDAAIRYKDLKVMETPLQAVSYVLEEFNKGNLMVYFLCNGDEWTEKMLGNISITAGVNFVNAGVDVETYRYSLQEGLMDEYKLAYVEYAYEVSAQTLAATGEELHKKLDKMEVAVREQGLTTDKEIYTAIGKAVSNTTEYDLKLAKAGAAVEASNEEYWKSRGAYGAVVTGKTVCSGYAMAYKALCDRFSLPCWVATGAVDGEGHAWNMIQLDGEPFYADCTFFDNADGSFPLIFAADKLEEYGYVFFENQVFPWETAA